MASDATSARFTASRMTGNTGPAGPVGRSHLATRVQQSGNSRSLDVPTRILSAASRLLVDSGFGALTQPRVSRAAGVSQSHLTYYFPRRADLILAVARHALAETIREVRASAEERPQQRFAHTVEALARRVSDQRVVRLMVGLVVASESDRGIKGSLAAFIATVRDMLRELLQEIGIDADAHTVAGIHSLAVGLAVLNLARDTKASRAEVNAILKFALPRIAGAPRGASLPAGTARPKSRRRHGS